MKKAAFWMIFCCLIGVAQGAPPSDESILKMMSALQLQGSLDQMVAEVDAGMKAALKQQVQGKQMTPLQEAQVGQLQTRMSATIKEDLSFAKMKYIYLKVFRDTFTQEEVNGINAFYSSPAGKAMMEKIPSATKKASTLLQEHLEPTIRKVKAMQHEFMKEQMPAN